MSTRLPLALAIALCLAALAVGCGTESSPVLTGTSTVATTSGGATTTTGYSHPWSGNYGTVTESDITTPPDPNAPTTTTTTFVPIPGGEAYAAKLSAWLENVPPNLASMTGPPSPTDEDYDPMNASQQEIEAWRQYGDLLEDYAGDLEDIEPPSELSSAHADFIEGWKVLSQYCAQLSEAVEDKDSSALGNAESTWWDAMGHLMDADSEILGAVGYAVLF